MIVDAERGTQNEAQVVPTLTLCVDAERDAENERKVGLFDMCCFVFVCQ